jgi:hypothetical protein
VEGLYRGWDELRSVPGGQQSSLRVIVLFTDGASNSVPGVYDASGNSKGLRTFDFPQIAAETAVPRQTHNNPQIQGLYHTQTGAPSPGIPSVIVNPWSLTTTSVDAPLLPQTSFHQWHRSSGIPTSFPLQSTVVRVDGAPQNTRRALRNFNAGQNRFPAEVWNINNAARNLVEIIAYTARTDDDGDYPIRVYTIGMGELVRFNLGTRPETPESILMRMANDARSPDFDDDQLEGRYYYAQSGADVGPAFQQLQNQIIRLTK